LNIPTSLYKFLKFGTIFENKNKLKKDSKHNSELHIRPTACGGHRLAACLAHWAELAPGPAATTTVAQPAHADDGRARRTVSASHGTRCGAPVGLAPAGECARMEIFLYSVLMFWKNDAEGTIIWLSW
jgi:hypothetical protein